MVEGNEEHRRLLGLQKMAANYHREGMDLETLKSCNSEREMTDAYCSWLESKADEELGKLDDEAYEAQVKAEMAGETDEDLDLDLDEEDKPPKFDLGVPSATGPSETPLSEWMEKLKTPQGRREFKQKLPEILRKSRERR